MRRVCIGWLVAIILFSGFVIGHVQAASSAAETRDWLAACKVFQDAAGDFAWGLAETKFAEFIRRYPNSEHRAEAVVYEANAQYQQGAHQPAKYSTMVALLTLELPHADGKADQFAYWTAEAQAKMGHWQQVIEQLGRPDGAFQQMAQTNRRDERVANGLLLLSEAFCERKDFAAAKKVLASLGDEKLSQELEWDRLSLWCRVYLAEQKPKDALQYSANLMAAAGDDPLRKAKTVLLLGEIHENLGELAEAIHIYEGNLGADSVPLRHEALLRIVDLLQRQKQIAEATQRLNDYLAKYPNEKDTDFGLLLLGELRLKDYLQNRGTAPPDAITNLLLSAKEDFQKVLAVTNTQYRGKAELNLGWCLLYEQKIVESQAAFSNAVAHLGFNEEQAQARFKLADILFNQKKYDDAVTNYWQIIHEYPSLESVKKNLFEEILYRIVQADLAQKNVAGATEAMQQILEWFPNGQFGDLSLFLVGQAESPARAREIFSRLIKAYPHSRLLPEVKLAFAHTYEREGDWSHAVAEYQTWIQNYSDTPVLPRAEFSRAWAVYESGDQSNAFTLFTNFIGRFQNTPSALENDLPARAQFWLGDYYWNQGDFQNAELKYQELFYKWTNSSLVFEARMRAGKSALGKGTPEQAKTYFTSLAGDSNCPPDIRISAQFALAEVDVDPTLSSNPQSYEDGIRLLKDIAVTYTNSPYSSQAWGRYGSCYFAFAAKEKSAAEQRQSYEVASNAFHMAISSEFADVDTRSMAELLLGRTLLKIAALDPAINPNALQTQALDCFLNILHGVNLRDHETPIPAWVEQAGVDAAKLMEDMGDWNQAIEYYQELLKKNPSMKDSLDKKIEKARQMLQTEKK